MTTVHVGINHYEKVQKNRFLEDSLLTTGWLDPCFGLALYDIEKNVAIVAHLMGLGALPTLEKCLEQVRGESLDPTTLRAFLCGGHTWLSDPEEIKQDAKARRQSLYDALVEAGVKPRRISVMDAKEGCISRLSYDMEEQEVRYESAQRGRTLRRPRR